MTNMWETTTEMAENYASGGKWLRLKEDDEKFVGMFLGEPFPREVVFNPKTDKYEPVTDEHRKAKLKPAMRIAINIGLANGQVQIWEMAIASFKTILEVKKKYGLDRFFEVTRKGDKGDTKTTYTILPEDPPTAETLASMKALELFDISKEYDSDGEDEGANKKFESKGKTDKKHEAKETKPAATQAAATPPTQPVAQPVAVQPTQPANGTNGHAQAQAPQTAANTVETIDPKVAQTLGGILRELPEAARDAAVARYLSNFAVKRVKDVPKARETEAIEFVEKLVTELAPKQAQAEVDPFA